MQTDQLVTPRDVLRALDQVERTGAERSLEELERVEPDLAEHLLERLTTLHHQVLGLGGPPRASRRVMRQVKQLALVCVLSFRQGCQRLWCEDANLTSSAESANKKPDPPETSPDDH